MAFPCHYLYVTDNLLDPSHVAWVHQSSFGNSACEDEPLNVSGNETGVTVSRWMYNVDVAPFYQKIVLSKAHVIGNNIMSALPILAYIRLFLLLAQVVSE